MLVAAWASLCATSHPSAQIPAAPVEQAWNDERALELITRARERRSASMADTGLVNFQADARLYVYFYLDRPDTRERNLVKTDQLALDVLWQAPDQVKQRIVGWRDRKSLPTNINYHLDHLTVVLENFGDEIRLGDGDEVRGVPHPAARTSEEFYDYRLVDSLTLQLPGTTEPVRVYELEVRPRDASRPAFLGSVFVDRRAGDIVRMDFTFTGSSYIDRYLDYINISLDNGLWQGRFWLPNQQRVEIRRRIPELDIPAGSVIRATMRVGNYRFNQPLPPQLFAGPAVVAAPKAQREAFPFEEDIHAEVRREGIGPQVELGEIRRLASSLVRDRALQRASGLRLRVPSFSQLLRYNRAEGLVLAAGAGYAPRGSVLLSAELGYAFGASHALAALGARSGPLSGRIYLDQPRDMALTPVVSGAMNTLSALFAGEDYSDLYFTSGAEAEYQRPLGAGWALGVGARAESQEAPGEGTDFSLFGGEVRPLQPIDHANLFLGGSLSLRRDSPAEAAVRWSGNARLEAGSVNPGVAPCRADSACRADFRGEFLKPRVGIDWTRNWPARDAELKLGGQAGVAVGDVPLQELFRIGGRGTLPGYAFRSFGGDRFSLLSGIASADLLPAWVRGRILAALGSADTREPRSHGPAHWPAPTDGPKASLGAGVGIFHDILHLDVARGLAGDGHWELIIEANRAFWDFL